MLWLMLALTAVNEAPLWQMDVPAVDSFLSRLDGKGLSFQERLSAIAGALVGAPYKDGPLGEGPEGKYDQDPLIDLSCADCVTFVEQSIALAASKTYAEAVARLQKIRYKDGRVDFEARNHFMEADWVVNNRWCHDITAGLGVPVRQVTRTISKRAFFPKVHAPDLGQDVPDQEMTVAYVPLEHVRDALDRLPGPSLILLIGKVDWLFAVHCGLLVRDGSGTPHFYHASSKAGKVLDDDLAEYLQSSTRHLGFSAYRLDDPNAPVVMAK